MDGVKLRIPKSIGAANYHQLYSEPSQTGKNMKNSIEAAKLSPSKFDTDFTSAPHIDKVAITSEC